MQRARDVGRRDHHAERLGTLGIGACLEGTALFPRFVKSRLGLGRIECLVHRHGVNSRFCAALSGRRCSVAPHLAKGGAKENQTMRENAEPRVESCATSKKQKTVVPREERHHRSSSRHPGRRRGRRSRVGRSPNKCDGDAREEETRHRLGHDIQGGGEDADLVWAEARISVTVTPGRRRGATVKFTTSREEERMPRPCGEGPEGHAHRISSAFVSCLVRNPLDLGFVQSQVAQFAV